MNSGHSCPCDSTAEGIPIKLTWSEEIKLLVNTVAIRDRTSTPVYMLLVLKNLIQASVESKNRSHFLS